MLDTLTGLATQAGSRLDVADERAPGTTQEFTCTAALTSGQREAVTELIRHDLGVLVAPPGSGKTVMACAVIAARQVSTVPVWRGANRHPPALAVTTAPSGLRRKGLPMPYR